MEMIFKPEVVFAFLISILLGIAAYFLKQLHKDFKRMEKDLLEVKTTTSIMRIEFKNIQDLLSQRIEFLEKRVKYLANLFIKSNGKEKFDFDIPVSYIMPEYCRF